MQGRKLELADTATVTRYVQDLPNVLSDNSLAEKKSFIKNFVKEVRVTGDKALLTYTIPLPPRGLIVEEMPVLSNVQFGGAGVTIGITFTVEFAVSSLKH